MATNKYNRGMPIIKRHQPAEPISDEVSELPVERVVATVIPVSSRRRRPVVRNRFRVRSKRMKAHTFFWALAS
jgi:hypothetical protein